MDRPQYWFMSYVKLGYDTHRWDSGVVTEHPFEVIEKWNKGTIGSIYKLVSFTKLNAKDGEKYKHLVCKKY